MESSISLSISGLILLVVIVLGLGVAGFWLLMRSKFAQLMAGYEELKTKLRDTEKAIFDKEADFMAERNRVTLVNADAVKSARAEANEQGRQLGIVEGKKLHLEEVIALKSEFSAKLTKDVDKAVAEARKRLTAEYELQTKLFTVQISPFVRISENKSMFTSESEVETGYQYQLLVNGIPAFQPHSIVEHSETKKEINEENVKALIALAQGFASTAVSTYLGAGGGQFARLAPAIVKRLPAKK